MQKIQVLYIQENFFFNMKIRKIIAENFVNEWDVSYAYNEFDAHKVIEANPHPFDVVIIDNNKESTIEEWKSYAEHLSKIDKCKESVVIVHSEKKENEEEYPFQHIETLKFQSYHIDKQDDKIKDSLKKLFKKIKTDIHYPKHKIKHKIKTDVGDKDFLPEFIGKSDPVGKLKYEIDKCINTIDNGITIIKSSPIPMLIVGKTGTGKSILIDSIKKYYSDLREENKNKVKVVPCRNNKDYLKDNLFKLDQSSYSFFAFDDIDNLLEEGQKELADWIAEKTKNEPDTTVPIIICTANDNDRIENNLRYHLEKITMPLLKDRTEDIEDIINSFRSDENKINANDVKVYVDGNMKLEWKNNCYHLCHFAKTYQENIYKWIKEHTL